MESFLPPSTTEPIAVIAIANPCPPHLINAGILEGCHTNIRFFLLGSFLCKPEVSCLDQGRTEMSKYIGRSPPPMSDGGVTPRVLSTVTPCPRELSSVCPDCCLLIHIFAFFSVPPLHCSPTSASWNHLPNKPAFRPWSQVCSWINQNEMVTF